MPARRPTTRGTAPKSHCQSYHLCWGVEGKFNGPGADPVPTVRTHRRRSLSEPVALALPTLGIVAPKQKAPTSREVGRLFFWRPPGPSCYDESCRGSHSDCWSLGSPGQGAARTIRSTRPEAPPRARRRAGRTAARRAARQARTASQTPRQTDPACRPALKLAGPRIADVLYGPAKCGQGDHDGASTRPREVVRQSAQEVRRAGPVGWLRKLPRGWMHG